MFYFFDMNAPCLLVVILWILFAKLALKNATTKNRTSISIHKVIISR